MTAAIAMLIDLAEAGMGREVSAASTDRETVEHWLRLSTQLWRCEVLEYCAWGKDRWDVNQRTRKAGIVSLLRIS